MGQTAAGCRSTSCQGEALPRCNSVGCTDEVNAFNMALARRLLDTKSPFGKAEEASCNLLRASSEGDLEGIEKAMAAGADINTKLPMWLKRVWTDDDFEQDASGFNREDTFAETTENVGANNSMQTECMGFTPLMYASYEGHVGAVKLLLSFRAKVDLRDADGMQAVHLAAQGASLACLRVLLDAGANPAAKDDFGRDVLQCVPSDWLSCSSSKRQWIALLRIASGTSAMEGTDEAACVAAMAEMSTESMSAVSTSDEQCNGAKDATSKSADCRLKKVSM